MAGQQVGHGADEALTQRLRPGGDSMLGLTLQDEFKGQLASPACIRILADRPSWIVPPAASLFPRAQLPGSSRE